MKILLITLLLLCAPKAFSAPTSPVRLSETYELANIILALTDYGKTDPWEVAQQSAYYRQVCTHFDRYSEHPLLAKVNYSREKWESYLSFRTDAYAFSFAADNRLIRTVAFQANQGVNPFEEQLELINDFVKTTDFRQFYRDHLPYYQHLAKAYLQSQRYDEMRHFLKREFGKRRDLTTYAIVLSPLVWRMNCHRTVASVGTDFITLPDFLLSGKAPGEVTRAEIASGTHMLFTELDHAFVNPLSDRHRALVTTNFTARDWDMGSGYEKDTMAAFNEYMTRAVYDLYVQTYFPDVATSVSQDWAMQNATRGFFASALFNRELGEAYRTRRPGQTIRNIFPAFVKRLGAQKKLLTKPLIASSLIEQSLADTLSTVTIHFSEPMIDCRSLDLICTVEQGGKTRQERVVLTPETNGPTWSEEGKTLRFTIPPANGTVSSLTFNHPWKTQVALRSRNGIDLPPYSRIKTTIMTK